MDLHLKDKIVLVTGGASGLGKSIVTILAQEGAKVAINYRSRKEDADKLAAALQAVSGGVDALVQSSGSSGVDDFMSELDAELIGEDTPSLATGEVDALNKSLDAVVAKGLDAAKKLQQTSQPNQASRPNEQESAQ